MKKELFNDIHALLSNKEFSVTIIKFSKAQKKLTINVYRNIIILGMMYPEISLPCDIMDGNVSFFVLLVF